MIPAYTGAAIRAGEASALAAARREGQPDRHMFAAAHALACLVLAHLGRAGLPAPVVAAAEPTRAAVHRLAGAGVHGRRIVALIGPGNNGGDGLFALAALARRGAECTAVLVTGRHHAAGAAALRRAGGRLVSLTDDPAARGAAALARAEVVLDAVLGTGARGGIDLPAAPETAWRIACDVPSGLDADSGEADATVERADTTLAMGAVSVGLVLGRGRELSGEIHLARLPGLLDPAALGAPALLLADAESAAAEVLAPRARDHKYSRGVLGLVAGSPRYPGAAILTAHAALTTGIGALAAFCRGTARLQFTAAVPEAIVTGRDEAPDGAAAARVNAWVLGPGLGDDEADLAAASRVLATGAPALVDASALPVLEPRPRGTRTLLTPHAGELGSLGRRLGYAWPDPVRSPLAAVTAAARDLNAVVLLKGSTTLVATPEGAVLAACGAGPELAVAGSGDTLAGIAGALLCTHAARAAGEGRALNDDDLLRLGAAAALLHGRAGALAPASGAAALERGLAAALRPTSSGTER